MMYYVKFGYNKLKTYVVAKNSLPSTFHTIDKVVWKVIWGLGVPSKIKNFLWRLCNNALSIGETLWKRIMIKNPVCFLYSFENGTVEHMVLLCEWTKGF